MFEIPIHVWPHHPVEPGLESRKLQPRLSGEHTFRSLIAYQINLEGVDMSRDEREDTTIYKVVVNHEEQYSIWPAHRENALGWNDVGKTGPKAECLAHIKEVWTDMRPLSLRKKMEQAKLEREANQVEAPAAVN